MKLILTHLFLFLFINQLHSSTYFQQKVDYKIQVTLNDATHELRGFEEITYTNNSPVPLQELYFHLYPNAYKNTSTPLAKELYNVGAEYMLEAEEKDLGSIDSLDFKTGTKKLEWQLLQDTIDICKIKLAEPLLPGASITISTPFKVKIPSAVLSRLGHNEQAYFITQWYPKPAVYDKNGWNYFSYLDKGEYYSEFGSFDVTITLPANYVVGATGELIDGESENTWLEEKSKETMGLADFPTDMSFPVSSKEMKTLHFKQNNIHDFAWFADKRWHVIKGEVELSGSKRKIITWSFFTNAEAAFWKKAPEYISSSIKYMSDWVGEYPYSSFTAVDVTDASGSGMEYPMITAIGNYGSAFELDVTIAHEIFHNWFYGLFGINERKHPWMDEGITNFYETRYIYTKFANDKEKQQEPVYTYGKFRKILNLEKVNHKQIQYERYLSAIRRHTDVAPDQYAQNFSRSNYGNIVYYKTTLSFDYLKVYLGDETFDRSMQRFYTDWKFKHPDPGDLKNTFETETGKDLKWFFDDLMRSNKAIDYSICSVKTRSDTATLTLSNQGEVESPIWINTIQNGEIKNSVLVEGFSGRKIIDVPFSTGDVFRIDANKIIPELDRKNNTIKSCGLFKKSEKLSLKFLTAVEDPERTQLFYAPVIGFNNYNSVMGGIVLHNVTFHEKPFEFAVMPMYAAGTKDLTGGADFRYHIYRKNKQIQKITIQETIGHYAYEKDVVFNQATGAENTYFLNFTKSDTRIIFSFQRPHPQKNITKEFELRNVFVRRDVAEENIPQGPGYVYTYAPKEFDYNYLKGEYRRINSNELDAGSQRIAAEYNEDFFKAYVELKQFYSYGKKGKGIFTRFFGGYISLSDVNNKPDVDYRYNLSGTAGSGDYLYNDIFLGRTETTGLFSHQFIRNGAGFTAPTQFYRKADQWMVGLNASTTLPGLIPFRLYANIGTFNDANKIGGDENYGISWELGVELTVMKDVLSVYLPFAYSRDIKYVVDQRNYNTSDLIRFELHLQNLNPLKYIRTTFKQ
ncbi:MAG: M1 family metallopeptidase [Bacteroidetes bacterium]|nr:M1 family metallopeptidase [Bacteroidota bacterium]